MASGFQGRDLRSDFGFGRGSAVQVTYQQRSDGGGGLLKRSLTELERQQQIQHALFLRSVKQKTHLTSPISPLSPIDISSSSSSTLTSSSSSLSSSPAFAFLRWQQQNPNSSDFSFSPLPPADSDSEKKSTMRNRLQELERQLLDDDEEDDAVIVTGSAATTSEWSEAMHQLISPPTQTAALSPSPTSSSSSSASCSPSSSTSSRQLLLDTASAISDGNLETAAANLTILKRAANPRGGPDQRLMAMMVSALLSRINPPSPGNSTIAELCSLEHQTATQMLYDASPCFKLGLMAANRAILEATRDHPKIHILDFDIGHGGQYADLIHALAERYRHRPQEPVSPAAPPHPQTSPNL